MELFKCENTKHIITYIVVQCTMAQNIVHHSNSPYGETSYTLQKSNSTANKVQIRKSLIAFALFSNNDSLNGKIKRVLGVKNDFFFCVSKFGSFEREISENNWVSPK